MLSFVETEGCAETFFLVLVSRCLYSSNHSSLNTLIWLNDALAASVRSEEHTSELQSRFDLVCRLLLEKKKKEIDTPTSTARPASTSRSSRTRRAQAN